MKSQFVPLIGGYYADESRSWSSQDCVNWLPTQAEKEGTRTPGMLKTPPGLREFSMDTPLPWVSVFDAYNAAISGGAQDFFSALSAIGAEAIVNPGNLIAHAKITISSESISQGDGTIDEFGASPINSFSPAPAPNFGDLYFQTNGVIYTFIRETLSSSAFTANSVAIGIIGGPSSDVVVTAKSIDGNTIGSTTFPFVGSGDGYAAYQLQAPSVGDPPPPSVIDDLQEGQTYYIEVTAA